MAHYLCEILTLMKVVNKTKSKKKLPSHIHDDFHAHLVGTNFKIQESYMHGKLKGLHAYILRDEKYS